MGQCMSVSFFGKQKNNSGATSIVKRADAPINKKTSKAVQQLRAEADEKERPPCCSPRRPS